MQRETFEPRAGFWIGTSNWVAVGGVWPFVRIGVSESHMTFRVLGWNNPYMITRSNVRTLQHHHGFPPIGIQVVHSEASVPPWVIVLPFSRRSFEERLKEMGYPFAGGDV